MGSAPREFILFEKALPLILTVPGMPDLLGGIRVLDTNWDGSEHGVFTDKPGTLTNDFFLNLLDLGNEWKDVSGEGKLFEGRDRDTGEVKWPGTGYDLIFGSNSELRAVAEVYGSADSGQKFLKDFVNAWTKVMELDRFDLK